MSLWLLSKFSRDGFKVNKEIEHKIKECNDLNITNSKLIKKK